MSSVKYYQKLEHTKPLLGSVSRFDDLDHTRTQSLDGGNVVREDTHVTSCSGDVYLDNIFGGEDSLQNILASIRNGREVLQRTHLVRKDQGKADLVGYFSVSSTLMGQR
jgi:hypothetical protein